MSDKKAAVKKAASKPEVETEDKGEYFMVSTTNRSNRRRAGITFGPEPIKVYVDDIDEDKFKAIDADPMLKISHD